MCWCRSHEMEFTSAVLDIFEYLPVDMLLVNLIVSCSVVWSWPLGVLALGPFGGTLVQASVRCCLWLDLGSLFGAIRDPQLVAPSAGPGCVLKAPSCTPSPAFTSAWPVAAQQMSKSTERSTSTCRLPVRLSHWKNLWLYSWEEHKLHRVGQEAFSGWGYYFPSGLCHMEGNALPKKNGFCSMGEWLSTEILAADPSALSLELPTPKSPHLALVHSALHLLESRMSGCEPHSVCWPFKRVLVSLCHLSLLDKNPAAFHS